MYTVDSRARAAASCGLPRAIASAGAGDVDADLDAAAGELAHRERVVDLGRRRVVDRERAHACRDRKVGKRGSAGSAGNAVPRGNACARNAS
jgi:hypothetical protein